jgi:hypothetical protein
MLNISGEPGSGKSEVLVHVAIRAAESGDYVLILCPTGMLVHSYRDRLPHSERIIAETIHSSFCISRRADLLVQYCPPTRLRRYDLILLDEASQVEDHIAQKVVMAIHELPHSPMFVVAADFSQLRPVAGGSIMRRLCEALPQVQLRIIFRSKDPELLSFLVKARKTQPSKAELLSFFEGRHLTCDLPLSLLGISEQEIADAMRGDPKVGAGRVVLRVGLNLRLTRNLDKDRGFVNGAIGVVEAVLDERGAVCLLRLTAGPMVLVHPIVSGVVVHLPCAYG